MLYSHLLGDVTAKTGIEILWNQQLKVYKKLVMILELK
jgi:hypothetical protein